MHQRLAVAAPEPVLERVAGIGRISVSAIGGQTRLADLYQAGAAAIRLPSGDPVLGLEAALINTAGGLTGGDRLDWTASVGPGAALTLTTPACEKIYRAATGHAAVTVRLSAGAGARLNWLPQETILFDRSALFRSLSLDLDKTAQALIVEPVIFGRAAMGETVATTLFRDRWRITSGKSLVHAEEFRLGPDAGEAMKRRAILDGARAMASLLYLAPGAGDRLDAVRGLLDGLNGGASALPGRLVIRLIAATGEQLREALVPLIALLAGKPGIPKLWSI